MAVRRALGRLLGNPLSERSCASPAAVECLHRAVEPQGAAQPLWQHAATPPVHASAAPPAASAALRTGPTLPPRQLFTSSTPLNPVPGTPARERLAEPALTEPAAEAEGAFPYVIHVHTGDQRGAGTHAGVVIGIVGELGCSSNLSIQHSPGEDEDAVLLERGTTRTFTVHSSEDLGKLQTVYVKRQKVGVSCSLGAGWFLDKIDVVDPKGKVWTFPCEAWFGLDNASGAEGSLERNLLPLIDEPQFDDGSFMETDVDEMAMEGDNTFSGIAKGKPAPEPISVAISALAIPDRSKVAQGTRAINRKGFGYGGEDSYFFCETEKTIGIGVADGVYAWRDQGIDPGEMSRSLTGHAREAVLSGLTDPLLILSNAWYKAFHEGARGSSTATVATINKHRGSLSSALLGDSGFIVVGTTPGRPFRHVKYRSPHHEHSFGHPFQLGHHEHSDRPEDALIARVPVGAGDVIIMGSDGLFDNVHDEDILREVDGTLDVAESKGRAASSSAIAQRLAKLAFEASMDRRAQTPYAIAATEAFDLVFSGGKPDDITVLCAILS
ncbi:unnamed protein product [Pedinophyceae sp. YPF-701]|nr:unnamed protein product [Pedinophyceae sp. YPF-701]